MPDFNFSIHHIEPGPPIFNVLSTDMEGYKKKTRLITTLPKRTWKVFMYLLTKAERDLVLAHYNSCYGGLTSFHWTSVPTYIDTVSYYNVIYTGYKETLTATLFNIEIDFEEFL
jgi:hypothetical protein